MIDIRPATADDRGAITALLRRTMHVEDARYDEFLAWKHRQNPFGASYEWVATAGDEIVGYRAFLRWQFMVDGTPTPAVRAVDTATAPEHHGHGIFRDLTLHAVEQMRDDGVAWVFNTPNDASRPGYLKMGWTVVGQVPVALLARSPLVLRHARSARQPAARWSEPSDAFEAAVDVIDRSERACTDWTTNRTRPFLEWRYGFEPLQYRATRTDDGAVIFRVRRRGPLVEAFIADVWGRSGGVGRTARRIIRATGADVAVISGHLRPRVALPVRGPRLTWRTLADDRTPSLQQLRLTGGDLELF